MGLAILTTINDARLGLVHTNLRIHTLRRFAIESGETMIKDVMVRLDGTVADDVRLAAAADIARHFGSYVIGLFLHILPPPVPADLEAAGVPQTALLLEEVHAAGDKIAELLTARLAQLDVPTDLRRFDIFESEIGSVSAREARSADAFVALRPKSVPEEHERVVQTVLFGSGRHLILVPPGERRKIGFENGTGAGRRRGRWPKPYPS
jgi:hypothetical protein